MGVFHFQSGATDGARRLKPMIKAQNLRKDFRLLGRASFTALKGVSFEAAPGEVLALMGPNGSGKTTTLKILSGILLPDSGSFLIGKVDGLRHASIARRRVGFSFGTERSFFPRLTVRENLNFFAALDDVERSQRRERVTEIIRDLGLEQHASVEAMKLSSGLLQRLAIARAIVKKPSVLLLDEPSRSLDPDAAVELRSLIRFLVLEGLTIVLASHSFEECAEIADRVAMMNAGAIVSLAESRGWRNASGLRELYSETISRPHDELERCPA